MAAMRQFHEASMPSSSSSSRPAAWMVAVTALGAVAAMVAALYFAGQDLTPVALAGTTVFVLLGGVALRAGPPPLVALSAATTRDAVHTSVETEPESQVRCHGIAHGRLGRMNAKLLKGINEHLKLEFKASHEYLAMSVWLSEHDLPGFATWMRQQSSDETMHAQKFVDHLVERDQKVVLPGVPQPPMSWDSAEALCVHVLQNEQAVTASINELYALAESAKDRPAVVLLQWFVNEQMEEEAAARAILGRIRLGGKTGVGLLMIDQELAKGTVPGVPAAAGAAGA